MLGVLALPGPSSLAGVARAQAPRRAPLPAFPANQGQLRPGTWAQYSVINRRLNVIILVRLAALERERGGQWLELGITDSTQRTMVMKYLLQGSLLSPTRVLEAVVQPPGEQPFFLPESVAGKQLPALTTEKELRAARGTKRVTVSSVRVHVPAGTFKADKVRQVQDSRATEIWLSNEVRGWPLVKMDDGHLSLELIAHGVGSRSQIRGTPAKLDPGLLRCAPVCCINPGLLDSPQLLRPHPDDPTQRIRILAAEHLLGAPAQRKFS